MGDMSMNHIIPVSTHYQSQLIKNVQGMKDVFTKDEAERLSARNMKLIKEIAERTERIEQLVDELTEARRVANRIYNIHERAITYHDTVCPKMDAIRYEIDHLEMIVEDGLWSLPKYRELLFIRQCNRMKKLLSTLLLLVAYISAQAQITDPVHFTSQLKDLKNGEAELIFKATIDAGWHVYSTGLGNDGPISASFNVVKMDGPECSQPAYTLPQSACPREHHHPAAG